jgi:hypothetical protein
VKIGTLHKAKSRQFELVRNRAGSASLQIRLTDPLAYEILDGVDLGDVRGTVRKCIRIRRNGDDLWSGPIWGLQGDLSNTGGTLTINCVGWLETLYHALIAQTLDYSNAGAGRATDYIISNMLTAVNSQDASHPLFVQMGSVTGSMPARNLYIKWPDTPTTVGAEIQKLSDIESGIDYELDPVTRALNLMAWDSYTTRENVRLGYRRGANNIQHMSWQESVDKVVNRAWGRTGSAAVIGPLPDNTALDKYLVRFEEFMTPGTINQNVLPAYVEAELAVRSNPIVVYTLVPFPQSSKRKVPKLFDDYNVGDKIYFSANYGAFKVAGQAIRVFGASVSLDDAGNETISNLMTSPAG